MNKNVLSLLLLSVALFTSGCKTASPPQTGQTDSRSPRPADRDEYNRTSRNESRYRDHRDRRDEASMGDRNGGDRAETAERYGRPDAGAYLPRQYGSQSPDDRGPATRSSRHHNSRSLTAVPGQFDFYVLNLSWSPEFCHAHATAAECAQHLAFTLHGLWPENVDGTYPEECSEAAGPNDPSQYTDMYPDRRLLQHEWRTHGTCSGMAPDPFFSLARRAERSINIPAELAHLAQQTTLTPAQITTLFRQSNPSIPGSSFAITCGNNYLTAMEVCLDKSLRPYSCSAVKTCGANQIRIAAP